MKSYNPNAIESEEWCESYFSGLNMSEQNLKQLDNNDKHFLLLLLNKKYKVNNGRKKIKKVLKPNTVISQCSNMALTTGLREKLEAHSG